MQSASFLRMDMRATSFVLARLLGVNPQSDRHWTVFRGCMAMAIKQLKRRLMATSSHPILAFFLMRGSK